MGVNKLLYEQEIKELNERLYDASQIVLYGAKVVAYGIYTALKEVYDLKPQCFVVSDATKENGEIEGIPIVGIDVLDVAKESLFILAVPEIYHESIIQGLVQRRYENYMCVDTHVEFLFMSQYFRKCTNFPLLMDLPILYPQDEVSASVCMFMAKNHMDKPLKKNYDIPEWIRPIQVGSVFTEQNISELKDDIGEHISYKNKNYSELTATYWVWKNTNKIDYKGICHYRRILTISQNEMKALQQNNINVVLPLPFVCYPDTSGQYERYISEDDFRVLQQAVQEVAPEYANAMTEILGNQYLYNYNMFLADRHTYTMYCEWLFLILDKVEQIVLEKMPERADRYIGYLGEVLTSVYFLYNKERLKIAHGEKSWFI